MQLTLLTLELQIKLAGECWKSLPPQHEEGREEGREEATETGKGLQLGFVDIVEHTG